MESKRGAPIMSIMSSGRCDNVIILSEWQPTIASIKKIIAIVNRIHALYIYIDLLNIRAMRWYSWKWQFMMIQWIQLNSFDNGLHCAFNPLKSMFMLYSPCHFIFDCTDISKTTFFLCVLFVGNCVSYSFAQSVYNIYCEIAI